MSVNHDNNASSHVGVARRAMSIYQDQLAAVQSWTSHLFAGILVIQWIFGIVLAVWISPLTWAGSSSYIHSHVWAALFLGGLLTSLPVCLIFLCPRWPVTRHVVAATQVLWSALLIHLTGG